MTRRTLAAVALATIMIVPLFPTASAAVPLLILDESVGAGERREFRDSAYLAVGTLTVRDGGTAVFEDTLVLFAPTSRGLVVEAGGTLEIRRSTLEGLGGAASYRFTVLAEPGSTLVLQEATVRDGQVVADDATLTFEDNSVEGQVAGLTVRNAAVTVTRSTFRENDLGIDARDVTLTGTDVVFEGGTTGLSAVDSTVNIDKSTFTRMDYGVQLLRGSGTFSALQLADKGDPWSEGMGFTESKGVLVKDSLFEKWGTAIVIRDSDVTLVNNEFRDNGDGVNATGGALDVTGNAFDVNGTAVGIVDALRAGVTGNDVAAGVTGIFVDQRGSGVPVTVSGNDFESGWGLTGVRAAGPVTVEGNAFHRLLTGVAGTGPGLLVRNNSFDTGSTAVRTYGGDLRVEDNRVYFLYRGVGVDVRPGPGVAPPVVSGNNVTGQVHPAIAVRHDDALVTGNEVLGAQTGIEVTGSRVSVHENRLLGWRVYPGVRTGILVHHGADDARITGGNASGFHVGVDVWADGALVQDLDAHGNRDVGVQARGVASRVTVRDVRAFDNGEGARLAGPGLLAEALTVRSSAADGVNVTGARGATIRDVESTGNAGIGFVLRATHTLVERVTTTRNGGHGVHVVPYGSGEDVGTLRSVTSADNAGDGWRVHTGSERLDVESSDARGNGGAGFRVLDDGVTVLGGWIEGNAAGVIHEGAGSVDARDNWWGDASGPGGDGPGSGDSVHGNVLYSPWLTSPPES